MEYKTGSSIITTKIIDLLPIYWYSSTLFLFLAANITFLNNNKYMLKYNLTFMTFFPLKLYLLQNLILMSFDG